MKGFDKLYNKTSVKQMNTLFTDVYNVEQPPFFNTNDFVYLSFILRLPGGRSTSHQWWFKNLETSNIGYKGYDYVEITKYLLMLLVVQIIKSCTNCSHYQRYIFKSQQNY